MSNFTMSFVSLPPWALLVADALPSMPCTLVVSLCTPTRAAPSQEYLNRFFLYGRKRSSNGEKAEYRVIPYKDVTEEIKPNLLKVDATGKALNPQPAQGLEVFTKEKKNHKAKKPTDPKTIKTQCCLIDMSKPLLRPFKPRKWIFVSNYHRRLWYCEVSTASFEAASTWPHLTA